jgi:formiminotetrahydrofolate cyclodeaminase
MQSLTQAGDEDSEAYGDVNRLQKLPADDIERVSKWEDAVERAIAAPQSVIDESTAVLQLLDQLKSTCNKWLLSDLAISARLAAAAARAAAWNVRVNLPLLDDEQTQRKRAHDLDIAIVRTDSIADDIEQFCKSTV